MMKKMLGTIVSLFITMFFMGIIIYIMTEGMHLPDKETWGGVITFTVIEFLILLAVIGLGKFISQALGGVGLYAPLCTMTVVYAVIGTALNLILSGSSAFVVILINLILLFVYAMIVLPFVVKGVNSKEGDFPVDPANPNNMPTSTLLNKGVNNLPLNNSGFGAAGAQNHNNLPTMDSRYGSANGARQAAPVQQAAPAQQATPAFCPECGKALKSGMKFCSGCGKKLQ